MLIYNYDNERAEKNKINNDKRVASVRKTERVVRIVQRVIIAVLAVAVVCMACCVIAMFTLYKSELSPFMAVAAPVLTVSGGAVTVIFIVDQLSKKEISDDYYDDLETQYHRLVKSYKKVDVTLTPNCSIMCICENEQGERETKELKPCYTQTPEKLTQPTLDLGASCLWIPDSFVAPTNLEGAL